MTLPSPEASRHPLLDESPLPYGLPDFAAIREEDLEPAIRTAIDDHAAEVAAIGELARYRKLGFHMDGARFANAVAHLGCSPADVTWRAGVEILTVDVTAIDNNTGRQVTDLTAKDFVVEVDGIGPVDEVTERILAGLAERGITA